MSERGKIIFTAIACVIGFFLVVMVMAWPFAKTPPDKMCLSYGGGPIEAKVFQRVVQPGSGLFFNGVADKLYCYPTTQRNYIISSRADEGDIKGGDSIEAFTADKVLARWEVAVYFKLCQDEECLKHFQENIGFKYSAWEDDGWVQMLNDSFRQQIENTLQRASRDFTSEQIANDNQAILDVQTQLGISLRENVAEVLGENYFCGPSYVPGQGTCPDFEIVVKKPSLPGDVVAAFERNLTSEIEVQTKQNEIAQREAEAEAIAKLNDALEGSGPAYVYLRCIETAQKSGTTCSLPNFAPFVTDIRLGGR